MSNGSNILKLYDEEGRLEMGLDEAGRGCLWGPVVTSGVILRPDLDVDDPRLIWIKDSKKLSKKRRDEMREFIIESVALDYHIDYAWPDEIEQYNILHATMRSMHRCVDRIQIKPEYLLVDGSFFPRYRTDPTIGHRTVVEGDGTYMAIAAASILAKTERDNWVIREVEQRSDELRKYGFEHHMGYGTLEHRNAIKRYGLDILHRVGWGSVPHTSRVPPPHDG